MSKLLPENRGPENPSDRPAFTVSELGLVSATTTAAPKRRIDSLESWLEAFLLFMKFKLFFHPDLAVYLASYLDIVQGMALHRPVNVLLEYDRKFREIMSFPETDEKAWFFEDATLMSDVLRAFFVSIVVSKKRKVGEPLTCFKCGEPDHFADSCPRSLLHPTQPQMSRKRSLTRYAISVATRTTTHIAARCCFEDGSKGRR